MKNKLIYIFLGIFLLSSQSAFAADKGIRDILNDLKSGKTIEEEKKYNAISDGNFTMVKRFDEKYVMYYIDGSSVSDGVGGGSNVILIKINKNQFTSPYQKLSKGKYKLIGFISMPYERDSGTTTLVDVLVFEKIK